MTRTTTVNINGLYSVNYVACILFLTCFYFLEVAHAFSFVVRGGASIKFFIFNRAGQSSSCTFGIPSSQLDLSSSSSSSSSSASSEQAETDYNFNEKAAKLAALGGDPSFLSTSDVNAVDDDDTLYDDEGWKIGGPSDDDEKLMPSMTLMSFAGLSNELLEARGSGESSSSLPPVDNSAKKDNLESDFDIMAIGGDPSFLENDDAGDDDEWKGWDGTVDENAHFDDWLK